MFGPRIFRSRWSALFWAAGVVWFAASVVEDAPHAAPKRVAAQAATAPEAAPEAAPDITDITGATVTSPDVALVTNISVQ